MKLVVIINEKSQDVLRNIVQIAECNLSSILIFMIVYNYANSYSYALV